LDLVAALTRPPQVIRPFPVMIGTPAGIEREQDLSNLELSRKEQENISSRIAEILMEKKDDRISSERLSLPSLQAQFLPRSIQVVKIS
jgi:hypothetical protein